VKKTPEQHVRNVIRARMKTLERIQGDLAALELTPEFHDALDGMRNREQMVEALEEIGYGILGTAWLIQDAEDGIDNRFKGKAS
jgi:hypothetical protein